MHPRGRLRPTGRLDHVRARERFLYERESLEKAASESAQGDRERRVPPLRDHTTSAAYTLMLAAAIIFIASNFGSTLIEFQSLSDASPRQEIRDEPTIAAAYDQSAGVNPATTADGSHCTSQIGDKNNLCAEDLTRARTAWSYFENNFNPSTGLVNSIDEHTSTTMWDTGSALGAFIAARDFNLLSQYDFDQAAMQLLRTLSTMDMFENQAPNVVYNTTTAEMIDHGNNKSELGIGVSALDLSRLAFWLNTLQCLHPKYYNPVSRIVSRWDFSQLIKNDMLYGMARENAGDGLAVSVQQGRLGYEQYAGKVFEALGFSVKTSSSYENKFRTNTDILGIPIAHDNRDPRQWGVNNYVVTDSYTIDAMELGLNDENTALLKNIFDVQKKRWQQSGIPTAVSDDNINQAPWYLYNALFSAGLTFTTTTDTGVSHDELKSISTKSAISLAILFPKDDYSKVLMSTIESAYDPDRGWYSGVYEDGGYNDVTTAHTNAVILTALLYKKYGAMLPYCETFARKLTINSSLVSAGGLE